MFPERAAELSKPSARVARVSSFPRLPALLPLAALSLCVGLACVHTRPGGDPETARKTADLFHHRARWKDYGGASMLIVPEKRKAFDESRRLLNDDRDLSISDFQLDEITVAADGSAARIVSKMSWYRLPSATAHEDTVVTDFIFRDGVWMIARQTGGPFEEDLSGPYLPPEWADAGAP